MEDYWIGGETLRWYVIVPKVGFILLRGVLGRGFDLSVVWVEIWI